MLHPVRDLTTFKVLVFRTSEPRPSQPPAIAGCSQMPSDSSILFESPDSTIFLIDIPTSISLAQKLRPTPEPEASRDTKATSDSKQHKRRHLISSEPLKVPYPAQNEPKSEAARAKILAQIPQSEREIHQTIRPLVFNALDEIRSHRSQKTLQWCLPRHTIEEEKANDVNAPDQPDQDGYLTQAANYVLGKRKRVTGKGSLESASSRSKAPGDEGQIKINPQHLERHRASRRGWTEPIPPLILSPGANRFEDEEALCNNLVKNTSSEPATIEIRRSFAMNPLRHSIHADEGQNGDSDQAQIVINVPPLSRFILCDLPISMPLHHRESMNPIPGLSPDKKFNLMIFDPPWSNRSVRRSGHYQTQKYLESELLTAYLSSVLTVHSYQPTKDEPPLQDTRSNLSIAAIWTTNSAKSRKAAYGSLAGAGFSICEEWIWIKTTTNGEPVTLLDGLWRKPYEVLVIGKRQPVFDCEGHDGHRDCEGVRRVIAAVPDVHSRKPILKEVLERVFFKSASDNPVRYSGLEVFARNLTAGWWACGNEVLNFNYEDWWFDE